MEVTVYGQLRSATGEKRVSVPFDGGTVRDALAALVEAYPRAEQHLFDEDGELVGSARVAINGEVVDEDAKCPGDAELSVHPAMQGG